MPQFFSLHFNPNQKVNISPPLFSIQIIFHPQPHFTGSCSGPLYVVTLQRKQSYWMLWTSTANLIQASSLLQLHTLFTTVLLIKNRQEKKKNKSIFICILGLKWQGGNAPLWMFDFELRQLLMYNSTVQSFKCREKWKQGLLLIIAFCLSHSCFVIHKRHALRKCWTKTKLSTDNLPR